jgi:hypothetical protein
LSVTLKANSAAFRNVPVVQRNKQKDFGVGGMFMFTFNKNLNFAPQDT